MRDFIQLDAANEDGPSISRTPVLPNRISSWLTPAGVFFVVLWFILLAAGRSKLLQDPGTFWHMRLGQQCFADGTLTYVDAFTFTFEGQRWLTLQWLGEWLMAAAYGAGGWDTLLLLTVTALAATYAWLASRLMRSGLHWLPTAFVVVIIIAASSHHFHARPHIATIALMGVTLAWLCDVESGRASIRRLWRLVPLFVFWTNVHGGVLGGLATVALASLAWSGRWLVWRMSKQRSVNPAKPPLQNIKQFAELAGIVTALALSLLANPYGIEMPRAWLRILSMPLPNLIQEHRPLSLLRPEGFVVAVLAMGYLWLLIDAFLHPSSPSRTTGRLQSNRPVSSFPNSNGRSRDPIRLRFVWLLPLAWLLLAMMRVRHAPLFAMAAGVVLADMLPHTRFARWLTRWEFYRFATILRMRFRPILIPVVLVFFTLAVQMLNISLPLIGRGWAEHDPQRWPVEMLEELRRLEADSIETGGPGASVFNALDFGGFLAFHTPKLRTFIDDRCELFGEKFLAEYAHAESHDPAQLEHWADRYGFRLALVRSGTPFDRYLKLASGWNLVRRTRSASLYRRKMPEFSARAKRP